MITTFTIREGNSMTAKFSENRRTFLKTAVLLSGSAVGLSLAAGTEVKKQPPPPEPGQKTRGYRLTEHIKKYYRTIGI